MRIHYNHHTGTVVGRRAASGLLFEVARPAGWAAAAARKASSRELCLALNLMALSPGGSLPRATPGVDASGNVLPGRIPVVVTLVCLWLWQVPERLALPLHSARPAAQIKIRITAAALRQSTLQRQYRLANRSRSKPKPIVAPATHCNSPDAVALIAAQQ